VSLTILAGAGPDAERVQTAARSCAWTSSSPGERSVAPQGRARVEDNPALAKLLDKLAVS